MAKQFEKLKDFRSKIFFWRLSTESKLFYNPFGKQGEKRKEKKGV